MKKICYIVTISTTIKAFFIEQLQYLSNNGFDVTVVCSQDNALQAMLGQKIRYFPIEIPRGISFFDSIFAIEKMYIFFKSQKFDIIQYSTPNAAFCASFAAKLAGVKIRNYHLMGLRYLGSTGISRKMLKVVEKITCALSTSIECVSKSNLQMGILEGVFTANKATVVWNGSTGGVDLKKFDYYRREEWRKEIRSKFGLVDTDFLFGFVGRITRDKGINEIFEAFQQISGSAKLLLVGNPEGLETLNPELLRIAKQDSNVIFHSSVFDIEKYYAAIDVLLLPSYREGFGNVIIEAAAVGTPAIVSDIPGPIDAIDEGKTAKVIPVKDVTALTEAMLQCIEKTQFDSKACVDFVATRFDSKVLCKYILKHKRNMILNHRNNK